MKRAIIIGASSGIDRELAKVFSQDGYTVRLTGRRVDLLNSLQKELSTPSFVKRTDVSQPTEAICSFEELIYEMGSVDVIVIRYVTRRWRMIAWMLKILPGHAYDRYECRENPNW